RRVFERTAERSSVCSRKAVKRNLRELRDFGRARRAALRRIVQVEKNPTRPSRRGRNRAVLAADEAYAGASRPEFWDRDSDSRLRLQLPIRQLVALRVPTMDQVSRASDPERTAACTG